MFTMQMTVRTTGNGDDAGFDHNVAITMGNVGSKDAVNAVLMALHVALAELQVGGAKKK